MKKTIICGLTATLLATMSMSCIRIVKDAYASNSRADYGSTVSKTITLNGDFEKIESLGITDIEFTQGPLSVTLTAPEKKIGEIKITVENGVLKVDNTQKSGINGMYKSLLTISAPSVSSFSTTGTGDIMINGLDEKEIFLSTTGTGDIELKTGKCTKFDANTSGTGDIEVSYLTCVIAECNSSGTGDITLKRLVADKVSGSTSGTGDITLSGECKEANLHHSGMGDINDRGLEITGNDED